MLHQGGVPFKSGCKDRNLFFNTKIFGEVFISFFSFVEIKLILNQFNFFTISMMNFFFSERATKIVKLNDIIQMF